MSEYNHVSVLLKESIELLKIKPDGIYVDCTLGGGGHSFEILKRLTTGHLYSFDQDPYAIKVGTDRLKTLGDNFTVIESNFKNIISELSIRGVDHVDGIIYDLGVSSFQFDIPERGFSYRFLGPLDMRMDQLQELNAGYIVNNYSLEDLTRIFRNYGEEKFSYQIARKIVAYRENKTIETTFELVDIIKSALPAAVLRKVGHPAKQVFQALRIEVNSELSILDESISDGLSLLNPNGRLVVITFHSLEDKIVKALFRKKTSFDLPKDLPFIPDAYKLEFKLLNTKVIVPSDEELLTNPRSKSSKLRGIEKIL